MDGHGWAATPDLGRRAELRLKSGLCEYVCIGRVEEELHAGVEGLVSRAQSYSASLGPSLDKARMV